MYQKSATVGRAFFMNFMISAVVNVFVPSAQLPISDCLLIIVNCLLRTDAMNAIFFQHNFFLF